MMAKNIYLKIDIVGYHIFINLLVNYIRNIFVKYRIFALVKTAILSKFVSSFFHAIIFFIQRYNRRLFFKMEN